MIAKKLCAVLPVFAFAGTLFFGASVAHAQLMFGMGRYTSSLSFVEDGEKYSSDIGTNMLVGYSLLPSAIIIPSLDVSLEKDSFLSNEMSVEALSLGAEIGFGISFLEVYAKFASGNAEIIRKSGPQDIREYGYFGKQRYGVEFGFYIANLFFEHGTVFFGSHSDTVRLFGIKIRIPMSGGWMMDSESGEKQKQKSRFIYPMSPMD